MIDGKTDRHMWANSYERPLQDVLSLQGEVARAIAQEIKITLTPREEARLTGVRPVPAGRPRPPALRTRTGHFRRVGP